MAESPLDAVTDFVKKWLNNLMFLLLGGGIVFLIMRYLVK